VAWHRVPGINTSVIPQIPAQIIENEFDVLFVPTLSPEPPRQELAGPSFGRYEWWVGQSRDGGKLKPFAGCCV